MPKQHLDVIDYFGPLAAAVIFASVLFILSVTIILHCLTTKNDDEHIFTKWGLGPKGRHVESRGQPIKAD
ncbi:hypothetical protein M3Y97_00245900 [Aphelenchoides bicaudatus]|nr:hypothetical protein M3Y97_00245900 [Aphelenchoides bicaudatus]